MTKFEKDMCVLAKKVYDLGQKYGGIYISCNVNPNGCKETHSGVTTGENYLSFEYWPDNETYTRNVTKKLKMPKSNKKSNPSIHCTKALEGESA